MRFAGFGLRQGASVDSLREALTAAGGSRGLAALATIESKAGAAAIRSLADELGVPLRSIASAELSAMQTLTQSPRVAARFGTGCVSEAAALAAAGPGARLLGPRVVSRDGMATAAVAEVDKA